MYEPRKAILVSLLRNAMRAEHGFSRATPVTGRPIRNALFQIHLWLALILFLPMAVIGVSGSGLLLQREILSHMQPGAAVAGPRKPIPDIVAAAVKAAPVNLTATRIELPRSESASAAVRFSPKEGDGPNFDYYVEPISLKVLGSEEVIERGPVLAFLITIHAFLAMPPPIGLPFVGWTGVIMILMGLSGLVLWWPRKGEWTRGFLMRRGARGFVFHYDLHRVVGIWSLLVFLAVCVSGVYLTFPQTIGPFVRAHFPGEDVTTEPRPGYVPVPGPIGAEQAIVQAMSAVADARVTGMELPGEQDSYVIELEPRDFGPTDPHVQVVIDAKTAEISYIDDPRAYSLREKALNWQHLLHFGIGLGWVWTVFVFLSGLLPLLLVVTGLTMWWKKRQARRAAVAS
jgi:uncharacterized iron-regulated membrane protein